MWDDDDDADGDDWRCLVHCDTGGTVYMGR